VAACTDEQLARLTAILNELRSFKAEVLRENPDLRPAERKIDAPVIKRDQPPRPAAEVSVAPAELAAAEVRGDEVTPLPRDQYAEVGLFITPTGDVSHNLGDDYARAILDGDITFEDARAAHEARQQQLKGLSR
jgi:hypothetical protein